MKNHAIRLSALIITAAFAQQALASGYHFGTQSISAQGTANASSAAADDASTIFYNPAGMSYLDGDQFSGVLAIVAPSVKFTDKGSVTAIGSPIKGNNDGSAAGVTAVPHMYMTHKVNPDLTFGLGVFVPFGDDIKYNEDWTGRYNVIKTKIESVNLNPSFAFKIADNVRIGGGISAQYLKGELLKGADFGTAAAGIIQGQIPSLTAAVKAGQLPAAALQALGTLTPTLPGNLAYGGQALIKGDDWGFGWNLGIMVDIDKDTRLGFAYRSNIKEKLSGSATWTIPDTIPAVPVLGSAIKSGLQARGYVSGGASINLDTPESYSVSWFRQVDPVWATMANLNYTRHSRLQNLTIKFDSGLPDSNTVENWRDTFMGAIGVTYRVSPSLLLRSGISYDESPVTDATRSPSLPDGDRRTVGFGANWKLDKSGSLDFGLTYTKFGTLNINQFDNGGITSATGTQVCDQTRNTSSCATLKGEYTISSWVLGLQYNHKF